jgi:ADP-ribose pyrophosphatase
MNRPGIRQDPSFRLIERTFVFQGKIVSVSLDDVRFPGGHEARHEVLHLPSAVAVVPLLEETPGLLEVVLVDQFRSSMQGYLHEIPAGILEKGEDPAAGAARELEEETGYRASRLTHLATLYPIPGTSAHHMYFYLAEGLKKGEQNLEEGECLTVKRFPLDNLVESMLKPEGSIQGGAAPVLVDAKTHVGLLHVAMRLKTP